MSEPVSSGIPCKQGIFQGISEILPQKVPAAFKKPLCCSDFLQNSLRDYQGKYSKEQGLWTAEQGTTGWSFEVATFSIGADSPSAPPSPERTSQTQPARSVLGNKRGMSNRSKDAPLSRNLVGKREYVW
jgi:hypothetical protein